MSKQNQQSLATREDIHALAAAVAALHDEVETYGLGLLVGSATLEKEFNTFGQSYQQISQSSSGMVQHRMREYAKSAIRREAIRKKLAALLQATEPAATETK